jgi:hypothetical protein
MATLTAANSVIMLAVNGVFSNPQQLQQFSADDVFDLEDIDNAETMMGVDGILSGGKIYVEIPWTITLMANSPSNQVFDQWAAYEISTNDVTTATMNIQLPGLGYKWVYSNGFLKKRSPAPSAKKIVQPRKFTIVWNSISTAPL